MIKEQEEIHLYKTGMLVKKRNGWIKHRLLWYNIISDREGDLYSFLFRLKFSHKWCIRSFGSTHTKRKTTHCGKGII